MKALDVGVLAVMAAALYIGCAAAGLWRLAGTNAAIAALAPAFGGVIAYNRGYRIYWRAGHKVAFLGAFVLPLLLGSL